jgi:hypothetical protein
VAELRTASEPTRELADAVLVHAERVAAEPSRTPIAAATTPPPVEKMFGAHVRARGACDVLTPTTSLASVGVRVSPGAGLTVQTSPGPTTTMYVRRFAESFGGAQFAALTSGGPAQDIRFPVDRAPGLPWHVRLLAGSRVIVCAAG